MECILFKYRCRLLGKVPRTREEYDPAQLLDKLTADKTLVLDSENLPDDWKSFDLRTLLDDGDLNEEAEGRPSNPGVVNIDTTKEEELERSSVSDFEVSIHLGFEMFNLSGCYFHFSQVT